MKKKKDSKAELCMKQSCFAEYSPGSSVRPLSQLGFPAWFPMEPAASCRGVAHCAPVSGAEPSQLDTVSHSNMPVFPITMSTCWALSLCQRGPDVSSCVDFDCQTNPASYWSPSEGCMLSSAFHITEKLCNLFFKNTKNRKLSFQKSLVAPLGKGCYC